MADKHSKAELEVRLWDEIKRGRFGMLLAPAEGAATVCQPMTAFPEPAEASIWFFTADTTELARKVGATGAAGMFIFQDKGQRTAGLPERPPLVAKDRERIDRYWNSNVAAWFPGGKADPNLTLLRFDAEGAEVWLSETGPMKYGWEILKANATGSTPDVGEHAELTLNR